jgi:hypothetical protein
MEYGYTDYLGFGPILPSMKLCSVLAALPGGLRHGQSICLLPEVPCFLEVECDQRSVWDCMRFVTCFFHDNRKSGWRDIRDPVAAGAAMVAARR